MDAVGGRWRKKVDITYEQSPVFKESLIAINQIMRSNDDDEEVFCDNNSEIDE